MAEIKPFKGWRYNNKFNIGDITSPLFDVKAKIDNLYLNPVNSIHISQPKNSYSEAKNILDYWKSENVIQQDDKPCIYVYYQYFTIPNSTLINKEDNHSHNDISEENEILCRKGFICNVRLQDWNENIILRHENTIPSGVEDRLNLLENIQMNTSATHGIYSDSECLLEKIMDESIKNPVYDTIDYQGVRDVLSIIDDPQIIKTFTDCLIDKKIIIADGHHRYESSLLYMQKMRTLDPDYNGNKLYNYHMMYLSNSEDKGLKIFPTHRTINNIENFNEKEFIEKISNYFFVEKLDSQCDINQAIINKQYSFAIILKDVVYSISLKPEYYDAIEWNLDNEVKNLDITVLHYFIIYKVLGISQEEQRTTDKIDFKIDFSYCYTDVLKGKAEAAIITKAVSIEQIKEVCYSGHVMPQKSTYFYPKVICGFVFSEI